MEPRVFVLLLILCFTLSLSKTEGELEGTKKYKLEGNLVGVSNRLNEKWKGSSDISLVLRGTYGDEYQTLMKSDSSFIFHNVPKGSYLLNIYSTQYFFSSVSLAAFYLLKKLKYRVDVLSKGGGQVKVFKSTSAGTDKDLLPYPLKIQPDGEMDYFLVHEGFQVMSLIKNPMTLMIGVTVLMTLFVPKMMASLDQEALQELQNPTGADGQRAPVEPPPKWSPPPLSIRDR